MVAIGWLPDREVRRLCALGIFPELLEGWRVLPLCKTDVPVADALYVTHAPVLTGRCGRDEVRRFYSVYFVGRWPADTELKPISRTVGQGRVIDECIVSFSPEATPSGNNSPFLYSFNFLT